MRNICDSFVLVMNIVTTTNTYNNYKIFMTKTINKLEKYEIIFENRRFNYSANIYFDQFHQPLGQICNIQLSS